MARRCITDVKGITVGHAQNRRAKTGLTVILCPDGATGGVDVRGSAPGTRETDMLKTVRLVDTVHSIVLSGGSSFGLDAASGVQKYLEELGVGLDVKVAKIPIVAQAVIFDLAEGDPRVRPDRAMAKRACTAAASAPVAEGRVGAGTGATVGKYYGQSRSVKGGVGTWSEKITGGVTVGALVVVNAFGDVVDPSSGETLAGTLSEDGKSFEDTLELMKSKGAGPVLSRFFNTTLAVVATDARLDKEGAVKVARMAHDGYARTIRPVHTMVDGDVIYSLSTGKKKADVSTVGAVAADVVAVAIVRAVSEGNRR